MSLLRTRPYLILFLFFLCPALQVFSQSKKISGIIKDAHSDDGVAFASVQFKKTTTGKQTDSSGAFSFYLKEWPSDTLEITCVGYLPFFYPIDKNKDTAWVIINLERGTFNEGVKIKTRVNKGLLLWRKIVQHKPDNNPYRFDNFSYELYNKLELDIKNLNFNRLAKFKPLRPAGELINRNIDSSEGSKYLPAYLTEAISDYYYQKKPQKRREMIKGANTNGIKNESMIKFLGGMDQVVNVYNNFIPVFDKQFISPASDNGDLYYNYRVVDTQQMANDRYYHLVFTPRRKGTSTFEGDCWVHAGTFAIQKMNLRLGKDANINFLENLSMIQEYGRINDSTWFIAKDKFVANVSPIGKEKPGVIGRKTSTYKNVMVNDPSVVTELDKNKKSEEIITLPGADEKDKSYWEESRHEELSKTEKGIIRMIDTLTNAPVFQKFTNRLNFIATGYMNTGNFQIGPWYNWITSNSWEGFRMRFDLGTNKHFDKKWWWHTYLAYGFGDNKLKGKAELFFLPKKHPRLYLYGSYTNDLDFGQNYYGEVTQDNVFALAVRKQNIPLKFLKVDEKRFEFFNETRSGFSTKFALTHTRQTPLKNLIPKDSFALNNGRTPLASAEVSVRFRFAYLEKFLENQFFRSSLGSPYPIGELTITKGFSGIFKSSYDYTKISGSVSDYIKIPPVGSISFQVYAGKTFGTLPYVLLDIAPGNELYYYNKYAFNMMNRFEFIHDRYAGINFEHIIGNGIFRLFPKLKLRQFWTAKTLWGSLSEDNKNFNFKDGHLFQTLDGKTYLEMGTGIDNIFHFLRVDFVWRLLPTRLPKSTTERFGVFGSFRLSF
ncbi:MAG: carboxypeptidase-like regulatory domain-containing protein [Chitinophagaceae bacterium]|nr:carboxypeptidase-like regulatory domain-containing protein [Chitinophagaceae bacterium]